MIDVAVVGSLHLDIMVEAPRLPGREETLMGESWHYKCGGKGGNQAVAAARFGARTSFGGRVGSDDFGERLVAHLRSAGVDTRHVGVDSLTGSGMSMRGTNAATRIPSLCMIVMASRTVPAEEPDSAFPVRLTTGRLRDQWHSMTRTRLVARLFSHSPEPEIVVSEAELQKNGLANHELVRVISRRGNLVMKIRASDDMRPGDAFVAMHWGGRFMGGAGTNALTIAAIDPFSKQPELKHAAVRIEPFAARWRGAFSAPATPALQRAAGPWLQRFDYAALSLAEGTENLLRLELATAGEAPAEALAALEELFGQPPITGAAAFERSVCACFKVGEEQIREAVAAGATLAALQKNLKCGTNCGSCVPELRRLVAA